MYVAHCFASAYICMYLVCNLSKHTIINACIILYGVLFKGYICMYIHRLQALLRVSDVPIGNV